MTVSLNHVFRCALLAIAFFLMLNCAGPPDFLDPETEEGELLSHARVATCPALTTEVDNQQNPIGGGPGYNAIINQSQATVVVSTVATLKAALKNAQPGNIIYVTPNAVLEIGVNDTLLLRQGVTLASTRGNGHCGATLKTGVYGLISQQPGGSSDWSSPADATKGRPLIDIRGDFARITGITFEGPSGDIGSATEMKGKTCITSNGWNHLTIDNNEFRNWPKESIVVQAGSQHSIHIKNNYFHHNRQTGFGYAVAVYGVNSFALIKGNYFSHNRHDIANEGRTPSGYEASYNFVASGGTSHNFDVHGGCDYGGSDKRVAGTFFHIHHNIFQDNPSYANIEVRGVPAIMCLIEKNRFYKAANSNVVSQKSTCVGRFSEKMILINNVYNANVAGSYQGCFVSRSWNSKTRLVNIPATFGYNQQQFAVGDFDDNDITDFFVANGTHWKKITYPAPEYFATSFDHGGYAWSITASTYTLDKLALDDFTGDGKTDVFTTTGTQWLVSYGASSSWSALNSSSYNLDALKIGDFSGDGKADVLMTEASKWYLSYAGTSSFTQVNASGYMLPSLAFGFFTNDATLDVFIANRVKWSISNGAAQPWSDINTSDVPMSELIFADINNDGLTDVVKRFGDLYGVSWGGTLNWSTLDYQTAPDLLNSW